MRWLAWALWLGGCGGAAPKCPVAALCAHQPTVQLRLVDAASGDPVPVLPDQRSTFTIDGDTAAGWCEQGGVSCSTVDFDVRGPQTIQIAVPGYQPTSARVAAVEQDDSACCPAPRLQTITVALAKAF